jgi:acyl-CoA thioester hydrolase
MKTRAIVSATAHTEAHFHDVDSMNVVWHGNYPRFLELGRVALLDRIDYGYQQMIDSGFAWPVVEMNIRYAQWIRLRQKIAIEAGLTEWENRMRIDFTLRDADTGQRLCRAWTTQVAVDAATREMLWETPEVFRKKLEPFL